MASTTSPLAKAWQALTVLKPEVRRYRGRIAGGALALIVVDFLQLWIPRFIKDAVDTLENGTASSSALLRSAAAIVALAVAIAALRFVWRYLLLGFSRLVEMHLREQLVAHSLTLDRTFYQRTTTGEIMALATNDLTAVQLASGMGVVALVDAVVMSLAAMAFMAYISPTLTAIAVLPLPLLAFLTRYLSGRVHQRFKKVQEQFSLLTEFVRSSVASIRLVKAYNQEVPQAERLDALGRAYIRDNLKLAMVHGTLYPISGLIANVSLLLVVLFGGRMTVAGQITAGDFVAFVNYLLMLSWPMMAFGWVANLFQRGVTSLERIRGVLEETPSLRDPPWSTPSLAIQGSISIRNLSFTYPGQVEPALCDINLNIAPGVLGIVGRTGSGKSTLCHLLTRLYPVRDQTLFLDGVDVNVLPLSLVRGAIAYVPQEVTIFSESIAYNIAMGKPQASLREIEEAAWAAAIHEEIMAMKDSYATTVGERGVKLSGGQRQRLAIARALLLDRPILIIDDGLSAVDMETEHLIVRRIASYLQGKTCILVSHRLAPLADAAHIVVMDRGRVVAQGTHQQLLTRSDYYAAIHAKQRFRDDAVPVEAVALSLPEAIP
jgi:ATP-binding cassette subfamily B protein